jgi:cobalamin biosynthesis Mg chelatase CobN
MNTDTPNDQCGRADRPVVPATRARQGVTGHNVRYVLLLGTLAVVVLFGIVYIAYFT